MRLAIFEDETITNFSPLTLTRPTYELFIGTSPIIQKIEKKIEHEGDILLFCREYLKPIQVEKYGNRVNNFDRIDDSTLLVNGLLLPNNLPDKIFRKLSEKGIAVISNDRVVAAHLGEESFEDELMRKALTSGHDVSRLIIERVGKKLTIDEGCLLTYPWELFEMNGKLVAEEFKGGEWEGDVDDGVKIYGDAGNIYVARDAFIESGTILDARVGPIYVGRETYVHAPSRVSGPSFIGRSCIIFGAQIREGCSIGDVCRVGGEVEATIFHAYSNKRHHGYIGHAYVGEWVNLGAGTINSDLKNTYGTIKMRIGDAEIDTGRMFVGCFVGDHAKTAIGTLIFSGKRVGVSSHLYGVVMRDVPSFTIYGETIGFGSRELCLDSAIKTARRMMERRKKGMTTAYESMLRHVFSMTSEERAKAGVAAGKLLL
ncbi:MAG: putative sugar nucleotidyl transferase [Aigarchaeota archaeon]|nr:putative sugar nucleotidyl transferase [Candidatus Pelearchaeum maunauluense]